MSKLATFFIASFVFSSTLSQALQDDKKLFPIKDPPIRVTILNDNDYFLGVHCKSRDDDLGFHTLGRGESFGWKFYVNFPNTTLYFCGFSWGQTDKGVFDMYKATRDLNRCTECLWKAEKDGVYGFSNKAKPAALFYKWKA